MAAKKNYHKPAEDPRTIGGGLRASLAREEWLEIFLRPRWPSVRMRMALVPDARKPSTI